MEQSIEDEVMQNNWNLLWDIRRCCRYNTMRSAWIAHVIKWTNIMTALLSGSAFTALLRDHECFARWVTLFVAFLSTKAAFSKLPQKQSLHAKYSEQYANLLGLVCEAGGLKMGQDDYKKYYKKYCEIQGKENAEIPEFRRRLMLYCESEVARCEMENSPVECASTAEVKGWHFLVRQIF